MTYKHALVVDDSKLARITLKKKLEQRQIQVEMLESGQAALDYLQNVQNTPPDIIFMDHLMPGIDGFEVTQRIKSNPVTSHIPVIMCSGKENDNYLQEAQAIGASSILSKPPASSALDAILSEESSAATPLASTATVTAEPSPANTPPHASEAETTQQVSLDETQIRSLILDLLPSKEHLRESVVADLTNKQNRVLTDFTSGVDQQLARHEDLLEDIKQQLEQQDAQATATDTRFDEEQLRQKIEEILARQFEQQREVLQQSDSSNQQQTSRFSEEVAALAVRLQKLEETRANDEKRFSQWLQEVSQRQDEQANQLEATALESAAGRPDATDTTIDTTTIDTTTIAEQLMPQLVESLSHRIQQQVSEAVEQRIPQLSADIGDQLQLQLTYQLNELTENNSENNNATAPSVDQVMGAGETDLRTLVRTALEEQLPQHMQQHLEQQLQQQLQEHIQEQLAAQIGEQITEQLKGIRHQVDEDYQLDSEVIRSMVEEILRETASTTAPVTTPTPITATDQPLADDLLDQLSQRFAQEKQQLENRLSRSNKLFGTGIAICVLALVAQWLF